MDTATRILDVAESLVQKRGFNGFSYADVATALKFTTASLHYHFHRKADLGKALIERYSSRFDKALETVYARHSNGRARLRAYADLHAVVMRGGGLCLAGMLAAEYDTLPEPVRISVVQFFAKHDSWLALVLAEGQEAGELRFTVSPTDLAQTITSSLEGAMLLTRPYHDLTRFHMVAERLITCLVPAP